MTEHGGNLREAAQLYGESLVFLDYSANINPFGVPQILKQRLHEAIESNLIHYPDPDNLKLREAFASMHGVGRDQVLCGNGASEILKLAVETVTQRAAACGHPHRPRVLVVEPAFGEYSANARSGGAQVVTCPTCEEEGFRLDLARLRAGIESGAYGRIDALMLGNPNNPTSTLLDANELANFIGLVGERGVTVILDEAFIELTPGGEGNSVCRFLPQLPGLILVRAVTKSLAVPGLRLGYALAAPDVIARMKQMQVTWSVNALAQCVADVLPLLGDYRRDMALWLEGELPWMYAQMRGVNGLTAFEPHTNFMLCKLNEGAAVANGTALHEALAQGGILIRKSTFSGLDDRFFRIAIRGREDNLRLLEALRAVLG